MPLELTKRSHLSRGGRFGVGVALALLGVGAMVAEIEPKWMSWGLSLDRRSRNHGPFILEIGG